MTTTGDLFVNIKGNNQGLKRSLQQSSRDIKNFSGQTEKAMNNGLSFGDIVGIGAISQLPSVISRISQATSRAAFMTKHGMNGKRGLLHMDKKVDDMLASKKRHAAFDGDIDGYRRMRSLHAGHRAERRYRIGTLRGHQQEATALKKMFSPTRILLGSAAAIAAVTGTILATNGMKWAKRINESAMSYSGAAIGNQARIDAANMRKDVQLGRQNAGSAIFRQNAANFRKNSGAGGNVANVIGGAYDAAVGVASNAVFGIPGLIMNYKQVADTIGGPK